MIMYREDWEAQGGHWEDPEPPEHEETNWVQVFDVDTQQWTLSSTDSAEDGFDKFNGCNVSVGDDGVTRLQLGEQEDETFPDIPGMQNYGGWVGLSHRLSSTQ